MGDELRQGTEHRVAPGIVEHLCEHAGCQQWGSWGYSRVKNETRWFCFQHRDEGEALLIR